ncbi:hypothetical protein ACFYPX_05180 [Micromonospora zamorensis]|uniref:hypothetical protein n=1 Tax=Micromonospora zamorensis TaxID=709883 RepID=UPI0036C895ED
MERSEAEAGDDEPDCQSRPDRTYPRRGSGQHNASPPQLLVNGLFTERALPTNALRLELETDTLHMAANAVTTGSIGAERS